ncbi:hypothetical protein SNE35_19000 [Paucibacter sp. R3-3]|uniref:Protein translocase subunit SecA n=1 Tax=Roseateles agri TaxID=3098619 RepID=A0ABU5DMV0_9BURK|nr:hypothetical protein [Paucibacter sp. R3-3]MDY0746609.1 hypothetical protein [Paucibacter sp. R3-3]
MNRSINTASRPIPGIHWGTYPQLVNAELALRDRQPSLAWLPLPPPVSQALAGASLRARVAAIRTALDGRVAPVAAAALLAQREAVRQQFAAEGVTPRAVDAACLVVCEAARQALGMAAFDCQVFAALAMMDNRLVEMATGEGKSLAAALAAGIAALAGIPVHVLTANDYLVERDAARFRPLYELLGANVDAVVVGQIPAERRAAYQHDVVYVTAKELVFDYLRDGLMHDATRPVLQRRAASLAGSRRAAPMLRGLCMAIVDEADSILIDEAQMPLILSRTGNGAEQRAFLWQAFMLSGRLEEGVHFTHHHGEQRVALTSLGRQQVQTLAARLPEVWKNRRHREETICSALAARVAFLRDRDYVVSEDGKIVIVDSVTGRTAPGRQWSRGLHALVSLKEGCEPEAEPETLAQITFQRFFRRYVRFGGMSGTLSEARGELARIYGARVMAVPPRRPCLRRSAGTRVFVDDAARWAAVVERTRTLRAAGRPVLIGCESVDASLHLSRQLQAGGIEHAVLNASSDRAEAEVIAAAGVPGQVTVSTNMAGRGTDIHVDPRALAAGGLHVLSCQFNLSRRHDRQLAGRAGRQGEPGSDEAWISLASPRLRAGGAWNALLLRLCRTFARDGQTQLPGWLLAILLGAGQRLDEARQRRRRATLFHKDRRLERALSFSGGGE